MSTKSRHLLQACVAVLFLFAAALACAPTCGQGVSVVINSPPSGTAVVVGQEVLIDSTASSDAGIGRVELAINGAVVRRDSPPSGNPTTFRVSQGWTPDASGQVTVSVVAYDANGNASPQATISLQVADSSGPVPTAVPGATAPPGATAEPGPAATEVPDVTIEAGCSLNASYVADVTIPDDTEVTPSSTFVKTWRIRNSGTCDWTAGFKLVFVGGDQMNGEAVVSVTPTAAGSTADLSVNLTAPVAPGTYKGNWRMQSDEGLAFGSTFYVQVVVPAPATDTPLPTFTPLPTDVPTAEPTAEPTDVPTLPPPAIAPYTDEVLNQVTIAPGATGNAVASCPSGSIVVGGGYASTVDMLVYNHSKKDNGWRAYATNNAGTNKLLNAYAVCLFNAPGASVTQIVNQVTAPAGGKGHPVASCPAGSIVTGGGWAAKHDGSLRVYNSSKSGNGWQVWADNVSGSGQLLNSYAICVSGLAGTTDQTMVSQTIAGGGNEGVTATCPSGRLATSGGFAAQDDLVMKTSHQNGESAWRTYATNIGGADRTIFSYVTCLAP